jgi:hypothetical protein
VQAELAEAGNTVDAKLVIFFLLLPRLINGAALLIFRVYCHKICKQPKKKQQKNDPFFVSEYA